MEPGPPFPGYYGLGESVSSGSASAAVSQISLETRGLPVTEQEGALSGVGDGLVHLPCQAVAPKTRTSSQPGPRPPPPACPWVGELLPATCPTGLATSLLRKLVSFISPQVPLGAVNLPEFNESYKN